MADVLNGSERALIAQVEQRVNERLRDQRAGHGLDHVERVLQSARAIQAEVGGNLLIIELAAWLHDVGDAKFCDGVERSAELSIEILRELHAPEAVISHVADIVDSISFRKGADGSRLSLEGQIVQDADRLDALGAIGIVRTIEYGVALGQPFYVPGESIAESSTGIGHFYQKLFKLRGRLNTEPARRMAQPREEFMRLFVQEFLQECGM